MLNNSFVKYNQLASAKMSESRKIVISRKADDTFILAQKVNVKDGNKKMDIFLKNPLYIDDLEGLCNLRDALTIAINECKNDKDLKNC